MHNKVKLCSTWDHYPVYAMIQEDDGQGEFIQQKKEGWTGWRPYDEKARIIFQKKAVMDQKGCVQNEDFGDDSKRH